MSVITRCGVDHAILGQLVLDDPLHRLGGDPQAAGHVLGRAADQRPEHELLEAEGVGRVLPLERGDDVLAVVAPRTAMEGGLVDPEAGLAPDVEVPDGLGGRLELDVGAILMPAPLAAAAFGQGPADLEAVSVLVAFIPGDLHAGGQVHLDRHAGHGVCPVGAEGVDQDAAPETSWGQTGMITPEGSLAKGQENPRPRTLERKSQTHDEKIYDAMRVVAPPDAKRTGDTAYIGTGLTTPVRRPRGGELTASEKEANLRVSRRRVAAEHGIGKMKVWRIASERYRNPVSKHTLVMKDVAGLHNLMYA